MLTYQNGVRYTEDSSFDAASAFQLRSELEEASIVSDNASLDEQELIKAAQAELRKAGRSNDRALDKRKKTQLAAEILQDGGDYAAFVQRLAGVLKKKSGGLPTVTLEYRNVCVETDALVGDGGNPTVWNSFKSLGSKLLCAGGLATKPMSLLKDVSGVIKPGRLTLVIGPPGSGKSVFLQLLSGRLREHKGLRRSGSIKYNGVEMEDFVVQRTAGLVEQFDYHIPNLTVIETVKFAASCQTAPRQRAEMLAAVDKAKRVHLRQQEDNDDSQVTALEEGRTETGEFFSNMLKNAAQEGGDPSKNKDAELEFLELMQDVVVHRIRPYMTLHLLGLSHVADTFVGNETLRGVSGGERKRVTTAEVLVGPQWALFMDEISTGLDSATTYSVVKSLRNSCHALSRTIIISLLQPAPEVMQLFDDLLLLTDGQVIYHGPVDGALPFFSTLGFDCPARKDPASFLLEVTTPVGQVMYASPETLDSFKVPSHYRSPARLLVRPPKRLLVPVSKISASFWETEYGKDMKQQLEEAPFDPKDANPSALARSHYARSGLLLALLALRRQMILIRRDRSYYIARVVQAIIMALIISSLFATVAPGSLTDESAVFSQGRKAIAVLVISVIYLSFSSMPSLGFVFATKRVFYKHRDNHFFPPWSYVIALLLSQMPSSTLESILYSVILYFISGLTRTASNFFIFLLVTWSSSNCLAGQFRLIAYLTPNMTVANAGGSIWLLLLTITNGFSIIRTSIPPYLIWIYWGINPLAYAIRSLAVNELTSPPWGAAGPLILESFGIFTGNEWIWIGVGYLWGWLLVLTFAGAIALKLTNPPGPRPTLLDEQVKVEQNKRLFSYIRRRLNKGRYGKHSNKEPSQVEVREDSTVTGRIFSATSSVAPEIETSEPSESGSVRSTAEARNTHDQKAVLETVGEEEEEEAPEKDVAVPFIPITLVCRNICYYVNDPSGGSAPGVVRDSHDKEIAGKLQLLHNIDFYVQPGCLTALMGGSGAGKTTLMDVVAGRKTQGIIRGEILVNGAAKEQGSWSRVVGYVEQMDIHSARITVRESLHFSARLRLDEASINDQQVIQIVENALDTVELRSLAGSIVGEGGGVGLSIEQRKRLSIAVELVANPSMLFMDEPTSGLDARAAAIVMRAVRNVANSNRTVVVTIHQPSMEIFEAFDQLILLQRGGRLTYFGPLGFESSALIKYLEGYDGVQPIRPGYNPATWMLEVTGGSMATTFEAAAIDFPEAYLKSKLYEENVKEMEHLVASEAEAGVPLQVRGKYATSFRTQAKVLLRKYFAYYWRASHYNFVRLIMTLAIALVYGLTFLNEAKVLHDGTSSVGIDVVQNIMGLIFSLAIFNGMFNLMTVLPIISAERSVYYRERAASMYYPAAISLAQGVAELPYLAVQAVVMVIITYWMVSFEPVAWKFFYFLLMFFETITMYTFFGQFLVVATPNQLLAQLLAAVANQMWTIFNGFLVPYPQTPAAWQWMSRISPASWILYGLGGSQLADSTVPFQSSATGAGSGTTVGEFVQSFFGYDYGFIWWCPLILLAYIVFFRALATIMLSTVNFYRR